jgi:peptidoglycan-N-acetylglucosamine deacetylase
MVVLAEVVGRALGLGALGANPQAAGRVALTFDDGPSEQTLALLEVLADHGARATFFVLEDACRTHPALLHTLLESGHQIEAHGRDHRHALKLAPWQEWAQVSWHPRGAAGRLYRPPYGGHSPFTRLWAALSGRRVALWDTESRDWTVPKGETGQAAALAGATLRQVRPGSVILLHDGPAVTPEVLRALLPQLAEGGLRPVTLDELPTRPIGLKAGLRRLKMTY